LVIWQKRGLGLWCLTPHSTIFQLYRQAVRFIARGNRCTRIKPLTRLKSLTNFITQINVREYRRDNQKWRIQRNRQHKRRKKTHKHNTICVVHHYTLTNTNNVNKKRVLLQTTGGKDKPNIDFIRKSKRTSKQGTPNVKTHNKAFLDFYH
jgi:hypothetical protein